MKRLTMATALLLTGIGTSVWAQTPTADDPHHPAPSAAPAQSAPPSTPQRPTQPTPMQGGMMNCPMMRGDQPAQGSPMNCPMGGQAQGAGMPMQGMGHDKMHGQMMQGGQGMMKEESKPNAAR